MMQGVIAPVYEFLSICFWLEYASDKHKRSRELVSAYESINLFKAIFVIAEVFDENKKLYEKLKGETNDF